MSKQISRPEVIREFASLTAHHFNNLLTSMLGYAGLGLMMEDIPHQVRGYLETIREQSEKAAGLVKQIVDYSGHDRVVKTHVNLQFLIREIIEKLLEIIPENVVISTPTPSSAPRVNANVEQMTRVFLNLLDNSQAAMPNGGVVAIDVELVEFSDNAPPFEAMASGKWVCITFSDTGEGIPEEVLPKIFDPFFTTKGPGRFGMGLAQAYGIIKQHQGFIEAASHVDKGTTISIYLPALPSL